MTTTAASRAPARRTGGSHGATPFTDHSGKRLKLPVLGTLDLPPRDALVYIGGLGALAVIGIIEWPVAAVVGIGHLLAAERHSRALRSVGEAMEQA